MKLSSEPISRKHQLAIARATLRLSDEMANVMGGMTKGEAKDLLEQERQQKQRRGNPSKQNPPLVVLHANPGGEQIAAHVQAILYVHVEDGKEYVHVFGGEPELTKINGVEYLRVDRLPRRTDVTMHGTDKTLVLRSTKGRDISQDF